MQLNRELLNQLVPTGLPPESLIRAIDIAAAGRFAESPILFRSYLWAQAITRAGLESDVKIPARFNHFSAGFVLLPSNTLIMEGWPPPSPIVGGFAFGGFILAGSTPVQQVQMLSIGELRFPLVTLPGEITLHGSPPYPAGASAACWVKNSGGLTLWSTGILTCRHVVAGLTLGTSIPLTPSGSHSLPTSATLVEIDEATIDASVLEVDPVNWPTGLSSLKVNAPAAPGQAVELDGRFTTKKSGTVLRVFHDSGYAGNLFGQRLITDCYGIGGDSGSLLIEGGTKAGMGVYMGTIPEAHGGFEGVYQDLSQVQRYFDLALYL